MAVPGTPVLESEPDPSVAIDHRPAVGSPMLVLGISDLKHDTAAALFEEGRLIAAVEEDTLTRSSPAAGIPYLAIRHCLDAAGIQAGDVDLAALATRPVRAWLRSARLRLTMSNTGEGTLNRAGFNTGDSWKMRQSQLLRHHLFSQLKVVNLEHHLCHAASAYYPSERDRALVLTLDDCGDMWSGLLALGEGTDLRVLSRLRYPNSLGWFYSEVTKLLGFRPNRDEHKTQWLSKQGTPDLVSVFRKLFVSDSLGLPTLNLRYCGNGHMGRLRFPPDIFRKFGIAKPSLLRDNKLAAVVARSAQDLLEEIVIDLAEKFRIKTGAKYLCVAGGIFLNVLLVRALEKRTGFSKIFVQPVAGNPGTALGAAYLVEKHLRGFVGRAPLRHLYVGPKFTDDQIKLVLDNCKTVYRFYPSDTQLIEESARLLHADNIVAWYQEGLEFGHRALGNRSILASPFSPYVIENLNKYLKHREDFHPFALSVPAEKTHTLFDCTDNCQFMASVGVLKGLQEDLGHFTFNGRSVRLHMVEREVNPRFWALLSKFGERAPAPVLLNTSFNLFGEPLVCDPRDAIRTYACSAIDAMAIGNFSLVKQ